MLSTIIDNLFRLFKVQPIYVLAPVISVGAVLLLSGEGFLQRFGLWSLVERFRPAIAMVVLSAMMLTLVMLVRNGWHWWEGRRRTRKKLKRLTDEEKRILLRSVAQERRSGVCHPFNEGLIRNLETNRILNATGYLKDKYNSFYISDYAWSYLSKNPTLLHIRNRSASAPDEKEVRRS